MADKPEICGFCHSDKPREIIYVGPIEYGSKCATCGATTTRSARDLRLAAKEVTPGGFDSTPVGIVSKMLKDPYKFFTGRKQEPPKTDN
ncbi:MAG: hypothetical protein F2536_01785 [Actinobacteria bacterium]|jgi:hypothetical protein|uniref:Unannotated protein n=1 Tax=freshwater metagenome TaxID=449393 RepID=A0A6J6BTZ5_9ZZZZ|nr:hypothetical protein [Actinomycetota bacterium]